MTPEEKSVKMWLLDLPDSQQRHYQSEMNEWYEKFVDLYHSYDDEAYQQIFLASLSIAMIKFAQYVEQQGSK